MFGAMIRGTRGMVATKGFRTGDAIHRLCGRLTAFPTTDTLAVDHATHINDPRVRWVRPSETPTAVVLNGTIYAKTTIRVGDEVTVPAAQKPKPTA